ncbi:MAG TPA: dephospho-CoA kinase [Thermoanaerobaculia bacterium]|jgi:dephospho-CoA kinase|nr:dephospho-CoA kinase [Thermoanaerobaculia bacterium]
MERALKVGLTGGLASGKSTVARWLAEAGFRVIDADRLVAELYAPDAPGAKEVRRLFGDGVLDASGAVDHAKVAERVFADSAARRALEQAIHPLVRQRFEEQAAAADDAEGVVILEATLLVEAGYAPGFDCIVAVEAPPEHRLARAVARGVPEADARARLLAQGDGTTRREAAGRVIDNSCDLAHLRRQVDELIDELKAIGARRQRG